MFASGSRREPRGRREISVLTLAWSMRTESSLEAKPPKIRLWGAPMRAQASMAIMAWGTMGM